MFLFQSNDSGYVILPGFDPGQTSDDDDGMTLVVGPPSPCNVIFTNADIIIDGRSSLMKKPKTRKVSLRTGSLLPFGKKIVSLSIKNVVCTQGKRNCQMRTLTCDDFGLVLSWSSQRVGLRRGPSPQGYLLAAFGLLSRDHMASANGQLVAHPSSGQASVIGGHSILQSGSHLSSRRP